MNLNMFHICLFSPDDSLLVGAKPAHLIRYSIKAKDKDKDSKLDVQLLRYYKNFCKRAIQQIEAIPQRNLIVLLSGLMILLLFK